MNKFLPTAALAAILLAAGSAPAFADDTTSTQPAPNIVVVLESETHADCVGTTTVTDATFTTPYILDGDEWILDPDPAAEVETDTTYTRPSTVEDEADVCYPVDGDESDSTEPEDADTATTDDADDTTAPDPIETDPPRLGDAPVLIPIEDPLDGFVRAYYDPSGDRIAL